MKWGCQRKSHKGRPSLMIIAGEGPSRDCENRLWIVEPMEHYTALVLGVAGPGAGLQQVDRGEDLLPAGRAHQVPAVAPRL